MTYVKEDDADLRREALRKAVQAAVSNAEAMADGAKVKLRDTISISDQMTFPNTLSGDGLSGTSLPGEIEVVMQVTVVCGF